MKLSNKSIAIIGVVVAVVVAVVVWYLMSKKSSSSSASAQAIQITVPASLPPATSTPTPSPVVATPQFPPLRFSPLSFMANYYGQTVTVAFPPIQVGDTVWVGFNTPGNQALVLVPYSFVDAQQMGLLYASPGSQYTVTAGGLPLASSSVYSSYATQQIPLTVGILRSLFRGNASLFAQLYIYIKRDLVAAIGSLLNQYSANPTLYNLLNSIVSNNALVAPLAITYNFAYSLGVIPPQVASYVTNPANTFVDFGYTR